MILKSRNGKVMGFCPQIHNNSAIILPGFPGYSLTSGGPGGKVLVPVAARLWF